MPRKPEGKRHISFAVTEAQNAALDAVLREGEDKAAVARWAIGLVVRMRNGQWPNDYPERGKYPRKKE